MDLFYVSTSPELPSNHILSSKSPFPHGLVVWHQWWLTVDNTNPKCFWLNHTAGSTLKCCTDFAPGRVERSMTGENVGSWNKHTIYLHRTSLENDACSSIHRSHFSFIPTTKTRHNLSPACSGHMWPVRNALAFCAKSTDLRSTIFLLRTMQLDERQRQYLVAMPCAFGVSCKGNPNQLRIDLYDECG